MSIFSSKGRSMIPNITLSTGRVIVHTPYLNGAIMATPNTGPQAMTHAEYAEYLQLRNIKGN